MAIALLTNYLAPYRVPLYERLADRYGVEVLCYGGGERYVPSWLAELDQQLPEAPFPARRLHGARATLRVAREYRAIIAPFAGGAVLPAAYLAARLHRRPFVLWASVWAQPRSPSHLLALPLTRRIYRDADAVIAYGEHVRRFVAAIRGRDADVFVAPQSVESELFGRKVAAEEVNAFRARCDIPAGPIVLYAGRLVREKGIEVLLAAWRCLEVEATLLLLGEGPLAAEASGERGVLVRGPLARHELPVAYAAAQLLVLPSIPTPRFREPWGLVCNEAMHQGLPVLASTAVGAVAGGLVQDERTGLVVPASNERLLSGAIARLLGDRALRERLGAAARDAVAGYDYTAMAAAFGRALRVAGVAS